MKNGGKTRSTTKARREECRMGLDIAKHRRCDITQDRTVALSITVYIPIPFRRFKTESMIINEGRKALISTQNEQKHNHVLHIRYLCGRNQFIDMMDVAIKRQTAFRLDSDLLDALKKAAKREHRSLNNFVECILRDVVYNMEPNEETKAAIEEARSGASAGTLNMDSFESFMKSLDEIE